MIMQTYYTLDLNEKKFTVHLLVKGRGIFISCIFAVVFFSLGGGGICWIMKILVLVPS